MPGSALTPRERKDREAGLAGQRIKALDADADGEAGRLGRGEEAAEHRSTIQILCCLHSVGSKLASPGAACVSTRWQDFYLIGLHCIQCRVHLSNAPRATSTTGHKPFLAVDAVCGLAHCTPAVYGEVQRPTAADSRRAIHVHHTCFSIYGKG
jgi:hypothetical protein